MNLFNIYAVCITVVYGRKKDFYTKIFGENGHAIYGPTMFRKCFLLLLKHLAFDDAEIR